MPKHVMDEKRELTPLPTIETPEGVHTPEETVALVTENLGEKPEKPEPGRSNIFRPIRGVNKKQKKFIKNLVETGCVGESGLRAGFKDRTYGHHLLRKENVQMALMYAYEKAGITDNYIVQKIKQGMNAKYPPRKDGGKQYPDMFTRKHYLDMYFKTTGGYAPEKHEITEKKIVIVMNAETVKGLKDSKSISEEEGDYLEAEIVEQDGSNNEDN